ncbi:MAG: hypothetical protein H6644_19440 [Caldilineaceae bacterium]|nr:hypothetical protein [Caldilineaceae bacterium]
MALTRLADAGLLTYKILPDAATPVVTLDALTAALQEGYHVLHLVYPSAPTPAAASAQSRAIPKRDGVDLPLVPAAQMNTLVRGAGNQLRLLVLASCQSAVDAQNAFTAGWGHAGEQGVPAVISPPALAMERPNSSTEPATTIWHAAASTWRWRRREHHPVQHALTARAMGVPCST